MRRSFYKQKKEIEAQLSNRQFERDSDGRAIINMRVEDDSDFLSVYSPNRNPIISTEVADFIENITQTIPPNQQLTLRIYGNCIDEQEQETYRSALKAYYEEKFIVNERETKRNNIIVLALAWVGILVLALAIFLEYQRDSIIWSEVIDIAAWVLLWEAVDISVFRNRALRLKRKRYLNYISMKIEYYPLKEK